jgi:hypothetical protein
VLTCVFAVFLSEGSPWCHGRSTARAQTVRACFSKKLLLSGIIYGILDRRLGVVVDELIHLTNDQLGKLVSP